MKRTVRAWASASVVAAMCAPSLAVTLSDTAPSYNPATVSSTTYSKTFQETGAVDADYFDFVNHADYKWFNLTYCLDAPANTDCGVDNAPARIRPPWAASTSTDKALVFYPQKLASNGGGIQYVLPIPLTVNARYRVSMRLGTSTGQSTSVQMALMAHAQAGWDYESVARVVDIPSNKSYVDVVVNGVFAQESGAPQAGGRTLRLFPQKVGVPLYVDNVKIEIMKADPLNPASDVSAATSTAPLTMDPKMFGLHVNELGSHNAWPALRQETLRLWGTDSSYWFAVQPTNDPDPTHWNWSQLDYRVGYFLGHNTKGSIIYTLGQTPSWASSDPTASCAYGAGVCAPPVNVSDFKAYVKGVASHFLGKIQYYEIWNEPGWGGFFTGTPAKLAEMTAAAKQALKEVDPNDTYQLRLIGPAVGGMWLDQYLHAGAGANFDIFNIHQYISPATIESDVPAGVANAKLIMKAYGLSKPIWNTETGASCGDNNTLCPANYAPSDAVIRGTQPRSLAVQWANSVSNADFFFMEGWGAAWEGLVKREPLSSSDTGYGCANTAPDYCTPYMPLLPMGQGFAKAADWLKNAKLSSAYKMSTANIYIFKLSNSAGVKNYLVWSTDAANQTVNAPSTWKAKTVTDTAGTVTTLSSTTASFTLKPNEPVLIAP